MSDALQHPPSFEQMVGLIEKLFKDYLQDIRPKMVTSEEIDKAWQRYKTLNHLWQDDQPQPGAVSATIEYGVEKFEGWYAWFRIGVQKFRLQDATDKEHAEWYVKMLHIAFANLGGTAVAGREEDNAVAFAEWLYENFKGYDPIADKWVYGEDENRYTIKELYKIFKP